MTKQEIMGMRDELARQRVENHGPTGCGHSFCELLCHDLHTCDGETYGGYDFKALAERWGVSLPVLGILIADHCCRLVGLDPQGWEVTL